MNRNSKQSESKQSESKQSESKQIESKQSESKFKNIEELDENTFEDLILEISLKKPVSASNHYYREMKGANKEKDLSISTISNESVKNWNLLSDEEKKPFIEMEEDDKQRYRHHLAAVKKYILKKPLKELATAITIYSDEFVKEAIENDKNPIEARKKARENWKSISEKEKNIYKQKKERHMELYDTLKIAEGRISGYILFIKDQLMQAKEKDQRMTIVDCAEAWKKAKPSIRENYKMYANEIKEERERIKDLYEKLFEIKPKRPLGAYKFFMMEQAKEGMFNGKNAFKEASKLWAALSVEDKERYQKIAKKKQLAYVFKKADYLPSTCKSPSPFKLFLSDMKEKHKKDNPAKMFDFYSEKWDKLGDEAKNKYIVLSKEINEKMKANNEYSKNAPKRPNSAYSVYCYEHYATLQENNPKMTTSDIMKEMTKKWGKVSDTEKIKYEEAYQIEMEIYRQKELEKGNKYTTPVKQKASACKTKNNTSTVRSRGSMVKSTESDGEKYDKLGDEAKNSYIVLSKEINEKMKAKYEYSKNAPKRPNSAYSVYYYEHYASVQKNNIKMTAIDVMKEMSKKWEKVSDIEKNKYEEAYQTEMEIYRPKEKEFEEGNKFNTPVKQNASACETKTNTSTERSRKLIVEFTESDGENERSRNKKAKKSAKN